MKSKLFTVLLTCLLCVNMFATSVWSGGSDLITQGSGTESNPYLIESADQLAFIAEMVNAGVSVYSGQYFKLQTDIDLNSIEWTPIGIAGHVFQGNFDGNNHTINGLVVSIPNQYSGLFGSVKNGTFCNINLQGTFALDSIVGGVIAYGEDITISNCTVEVQISGANTVSQLTYLGGVLGKGLRVNIQDCTSHGSIAANATYITNCVVQNRQQYRKSILIEYRVGGIVGDLEYATILRCMNDAHITIESTSAVNQRYTSSAKDNDRYPGIDINNLSSLYIGGIIGSLRGVQEGTWDRIAHLINKGNISGIAHSNFTEIQTASRMYGQTWNWTNSPQARVGGIAGYTHTYGTFNSTTYAKYTYQCLENEGNVNASGTSYFVPGNAFNNISKDDEAHTNKDTRAAGIFAEHNDVTCTTWAFECVNKGNITSDGTSSGLGSNQMKCAYCYNSGIITGETVRGISDQSAKNCYNVGTLVGTTVSGISKNPTNSYYLSTCGATQGGVSKTDVQMKSASFPIMLNADSTVYYRDTKLINNGYPIFARQIVDTVLFDAEFGICAIEKKVVQFKTQYGELPIASREGYEFEGWYTEDGTLVTDTTLVTLVTDHTLHARWKTLQYTIMFENYDGMVLQNNDVAYGDMPEYRGATPTKAEDANYTYAFSGWSPAIVAATAAATYTAQFTATPKPSPAPAGVEMVDLGLPSGIKWANMNVGATSPEEYGLYFAWGETQGYTGNTGDGRPFDWASYKWCNGLDDTMTKYCTSSSYGTVDNKTTLDPEDDAAHVNWGGSWRMPTHTEQQELVNNCTATWTSNYNGTGVAGCIFTSNINGNSIFLPAAGYRSGTSLYDVGSYGCYWSSSLSASSYYAWRLEFYSENAFASDDSGRNYGQSVRAVCPPTTYTITFLGANGETLQSSEVTEGEMPEYTGATPTKAEDANYTYAFSGWSPAIVAATAAATYTAQFTATPKVTKHTLSFYTLTSRRGTLFSSAEVAVGDAIPYPADAAIAAAFGVSTDQYGIVWKTGSKQLVPADATMPDSDWSLYADTVRLAAPTHTATFYVLTTFSGEYLSEAEVEEGQVIPFPTDAAVAAAFGVSLDQYNVVWFDENDNVLSATSTMPGTNIECFADIERKPDPTYALRFFTYTTFSGELLSSTTLQAGKTIPFPTDAAVAAAFGVSLDQYDVVWYDEDDNVLTRTTKMPAHAFDCYADIQEKAVQTYTLTFMTLNSRRGTVFGSPLQLAAGAAIPWPADAAITAVFGKSADEYDVVWMDNSKQAVSRDMAMPAANLTLYAEVAAKPLPGHVVSFYTYTTFSGALLSSTQVETGEVVPFPSDEEIAAAFGYSLDRYDVVWTDADDNEVEMPILMPDADVAYYADMVEKTIPTPDVLSNYAVEEPVYDENTDALSMLRVGYRLVGNINVSASALSTYLNQIEKDAAVYVDLTGVSTTETFDIAAVLPDDLNPNCLFYVHANAHITGVNVVTITDADFDVDMYDGVSQAPNRAIYYDLTDKYPFANKYAFKAVKATYHRDFQSGKWNMITLPFDVTVKTWDKGSWWCATFNGFNSGMQEFNFIQSTTLSANVPHVLMSANQRETELVAQNTLVHLTDSPLRRRSTVVGDEALLWGVYEKTCPAISSEYRYFTLNAGGNMVRFSSPTSSIGATRAYLRVPAAAVLAPSRIVISDLDTEETVDIIWEDTTVDPGITTDFEDMSACHTAPVVHDDRIYAVDGKYVGMERDNLPTGVYMQNGEKFVIFK